MVGIAEGPKWTSDTAYGYGRLAGFATQGADAAERRQWLFASPATLPGFHAGRLPRNKGLRCPADPLKVEEIIAVMRAAGDGAHGRRLRGLIAVLWRAGLRIQEALALAEADLDHRRGSVLVRRGKGGRRREVGMDAWGWQELQPWLESRLELPVGPLFCDISGRTSCARWAPAAARAQLRPLPSPPVSGVASRPISSGTRTRSRWRAKVSR